MTKSEKIYRVGRSPSGGLGLFSKAQIKKGQRILEYIGPLLTEQQTNEKCGRYLFEVNSRWTIDGSGRSNVARYMNHSCRPNCEPIVVGKRVFLVSRHKIRPDEELNYNYGPEYFNYFIKPYGCQCVKCLESIQ